MIEIRYIGATNTKDSRVKLVDTRFGVSITLARDYSYDGFEQAQSYLIDNGFDIIGKASNEINGKDYLFISDFEPLTER